MAKGNQKVRNALPALGTDKPAFKPTKTQVLDNIMQRYEQIRVLENEIRTLRAAYPNALSDDKSPVLNGATPEAASVPAK